MKKFLMALAVSALTTFASAAALPSKGNIYSIFPEPEAEHGESAKLVAGDKVRFVVRMLAYNGSEGAPAAWGRQHIGIGSEILDDVTNPLKLGLIVSGKLVEAEIVDVEPIAVVSGASTVYPCTDLHCVYTVKNGDLALPVQLALKGSTKNNPLYVKSDAATDSTEYFLFNNDKWALQATIGGDTATAGMYFCSDADANMAASVWETIGTRVSDYDLTQADFRVNTLNFDNSSYTVENTSVLTGNIVLNGANTTESQTVYAWVKNESVAKMVGDDVNEVLVDGIVRQVKTIKFPAGVTSRPFTVLGLANSGSDEIILSSTQGLRRNAAGDILEMYLSVPVNGAPPPPPSVKLSFKEADPSAIEKTIDTPVLFDKISGTPVYVTINPATSTNFKLKIAHTCGQLDPIAEGNIAMSQTGTPRSTFDGTVYDEISIAAGQTSAVFYVYPLGGTDATASDGIVFTPVLPGTVTGYETQNATLILKNDHKPVVVQPEIPEGADAYDCGVVETTGFELPLTVKDCYRDLQSSFNIKISYSNSKSMTTNVTFKTGAQTIFVKDYGSKDGPRTADVRVTEAGNPYSYTELKIKFDVKPARTVTATLYDASTEESKHEGSEFKEGAEPLVRFVLSEPVASDEDRWAFLEPLNDASRDYVDSTTFEYGVKIPAGQTVSALSNKIALSLKDGNDKTDGLKGEQLEYRVYVRTAAKLTEGEEDTNYASINLELTVDNVHPITTTLYDENLSPIADNGTVSYKIPCGVDYTFMAEVADPAVLDEDAGLVTIWAWTDDEGARIWNYEVVEGGAGETVIEKKINFTQRESTQKLFVMVLDKDMNATYLTNPLSSGSSRTEIMKALPTLRKKGVAEYTINVPVDTKPMVTLTPVDFNYDDLTISEDASTGYIRVKLSDLTKGPLELKVTAKGPTSNPGSFAFLNPNDLSQGTTEVTLTIPMGATEPAESDIYAAGKGLRIKYDLLDGTAGSIAEGWLLTAEVTQYEDMNYFAKGTKRIYIANVAPKMTPVEPANLTTNKSQSVGIPFDLTWTARDVAADLKGTGLKARWYINDVLDATLNSDVPADQAGVTQTTSITLRDEGFTVVRLEISDKDGEEYDGLVTRRWYYEIPASKKLIVTPVGPSTNTKTKYRNAKGLGTGRVWADGGLNNIEAFEQTWSYGIKTAAAGVYAFGYPRGEQIDNGTLAPNGRDVAINEDGSLYKTGENHYVSNEEFASFFYRWAYVIPNEKGGPGTYELGPIDPKLSSTTLFRETIQLDQWEDKKESYMPRQVEAIFAREYRAGDGVGDINADGIPDLVVRQFALGGSGVGESPEDDFTDLSQENLDNDALPETGRNLFTSTIPGAKDSWLQGLNLFTAKMEVRGVHDGLNDALVKLGIPGAKYDGATAERDYSKAEWRAYLASGKDPKWSPENPTDPLLEDTDHDGFPDGYEYYYWYWAHVGAIDDKDNWTRLTGEKYDPLHPTKGTLMTPEQIEEIVNPTVPYKGDILDKDSVDSDGDGLPDLLEFELGTNPFHWDTDGDGMPDGWEVRQSNTDPCKADAGANADGDYMASIRIPDMVVYGTLQSDGYVKYYAVPEGAVTPVPGDEVPAWIFTSKGEKYALIVDDGDDESSYDKYFYKETAPESVIRHYLKETQSRTKICKLIGDGNHRGEGAELEAGREVSVPNFGTFTELTLGSELTSNAPFLERAYEAFRYGSVTEVENNVTYEVYTIAKDIAGTVPADTIVVRKALPFHLYYIHHQVYQRRGFYFPVGDEALDTELGGLTLNVDMGTGFNPLTAWHVNSQGKVGSRYNANNMENLKADPVAGLGGLTLTPFGSAIDTRGYTAIDEFLLMNFAHACGQIDDADVTPYSPKHPGWRQEQVWAAWTTNAGVAGAENTPEAQGPAADSDGDGCPDGWELYISCGPGSSYIPGNPELSNRFNNARTYNPRVNSNSDCGFLDSNKDPITGARTADMAPVREFSATDTALAYPNTPSIQRNANAKWINKFLPTDPWSSDTDGDGLKDSEESAFIYGSELFNDVRTDNGKFCTPGGGLNPCSWDTDFDGLPDPWELQFKGAYITPESASKALAPYVRRDYERRVAAEKYYVEGTLPNAPGCYFCAGMDGTTPDSYTNGEMENQLLNVNRDYDYDGLDPWQEYLTGLIRAFRYDDTLSPWKVMMRPAQDEDYGKVVFTEQQLDEYLRDGAPINPLRAKGGDANQFEMTGGSNPNLIFGKLDTWGAYGSVGRRSWDPVNGNWYYFYDGPNHCLRKFNNAYERRIACDLYATVPGVLEAFADDDEFGFRFAMNEIKNPLGQSLPPTKYASTDPTNEDSDGDGMDDYYELFHGLNPLYGGESGRDLVSEAWAGQVTAKKNYWTVAKYPDADLYDFVKFPWMAGDPAADPDGDDIRNVEEAIQANAQEPSTWLHTDPSPFWMTDTTSSNSLVRTSFSWVSPADQLPATIVIDNPFYDPVFFPERPEKIAVDGYVPEGAYEPDTMIAHIWKVLSSYNYEFEENEGYDSDHDGLSDYQETSSIAAGQTNPQDASDPARRQAMYFPGANSALQAQVDPLFAVNSNSQLNFLSFTVECWVKPERATEQVIIERTVNTTGANPMDEQMLRRNFQLGITEGGCFYAAYDHNGTGTTRILAVQSTPIVVDRWAHLAATYDGANLNLYVDGRLAESTPSTLHPATVSVTTRTDVAYDDKFLYGGDTTENILVHQVKTLVDDHAIIYGASAATAEALTLSKATWEDYEKFYKGYLDEVRIWDGARKENEIAADYKRRYTREDLIANRNAVYDAAVMGAVRAVNREYVVDELPPELAYHYNFNGLFAGASEGEVAQVPFGYDGDKTRAVRPEGWETPWWANLELRSTVYKAKDYIPWIVNTAAHLPRFDGTTQDSVFWSDDYAAFNAATALGYKSYLFPHTHELYPMRQPLLTALSTQSTRTTIVAEMNTDLTDNQKFIRAFTNHASGIDGTELLPLGGAYAKYSTDMWDDLGPSTTWEVIGTDKNDNFLGDWWELYVEAHSERYTDLNGHPIAYGTLKPDTQILRDGQFWSAIEAYRRDVASGAHPNSNGADEKYAQLDDANGNGLPDWWENMYQLNGASGQEDSDGDGLSNYAEYLLSEVFVLKDDKGRRLKFNPRNPKSVNSFNLDYFARVGELYAGEIFTDHDFIEDTWEDLYAANTKAVSRLKYDAHLDNDGDGWSNWAEARYSQMSREIAADQVNHYNVMDELLADYPIPSINLKVTYNGLDRNKIEKAPLVVAATVDPTLRQAYNAIWNVAGESEASSADKDSASSGDEGSKFVIGRWSDRHVIGNLTPGDVKADTVRLQTAYDPSIEMFTWYIYSFNEVVYRGTRDEYRAAQRKYGTRNVHLLKTGTTFNDMVVNRRVDETTQTLTLAALSTQEPFCTINLKTGAFDINLGAFKGILRETDDDSSTLVSCEDLTYRLVYQTNPSVGLPRQLYLGQADVGHVREGKNSFVAWADLNGDGKWDPGEPFGFTKDVNVGWNSATAEIELTETHPVFARVKIATGENDRQYWWGTESGNVTNLVEGVLPGERMVRVRVVRTSINGRALAPKLQYYEGQLTRIEDLLDLPNTVVLDKYMDLGVRDFIHEGDFLTGLGDGHFDIDWDTFEPEVLASRNLEDEDPMLVVYRIVLGESSVSPTATNNLASVAITRAFDAFESRNIAQPKLEGGNVLEARPTLKWTMNNANSYPAFRVAIYGKDNFTDPIWISDVQKAPVATLATDSDISTYSWTLPVTVGDRFPGTEKILENDKEYYWSVMMYNSKFREYIHDDVAEYTEKGISCGKFRMAVPSANNARGNADVCVKYFGPAATYTKGKWVKGPVRVQAFASADFTGEPVAGAIVTDLASIADTKKEHATNAKIIGIPAGTYYFRAYIDANDNGKCDAWESKGYLCGRGTTSPTPFNPTGVLYSPEMTGTATKFDIYLEDADTDNDSLPDGWEYATYGDLDSIGTESLTSGTDLSKHDTAIGVSLYPELVGALEREYAGDGPTTGMAGTVLMALANPNVAGLILGLEKDENGSFILPAPTVLENGLTIKAVVFEPAAGTVKMTVAAQAEGVSSTIYATQSTATVKLAIEYSEDLSSWTKTKPITISVKAGTTEETVDVTVDALKGSKAGFFRVSIEQ